MKEQSLLFTSGMVRAILGGSKTQTRRVPIERYRNWKVGDTIWVREAWAIYDLWMKPKTFDEGASTIWLFSGKPKVEHKDSIIYRADMKNPNRLKGGWRPSIHMPRWAARIFLEITGLRDERVQDIGLVGVCDCYNEMGKAYRFGSTGKQKFQDLWDSINAKRHGGIYAWGENPEVKVIEFKLKGENNVFSTDFYHFSFKPVRNKS